MNIEFFRIDRYIHSYKVEGLHSFLSRFREEFNSIFLEKQKVKGNILNEEINNPIIEEGLDKIFINIIENNYIVDRRWAASSLNLYSQNNKYSQSIYHNHIDSSAITATTYLDPTTPQEGGGIQFFLHQTEEIIINPLPDYIYFFPSWIMHKPLPQTSTQNRYCVNWGYECSKIPIHKLTGDKW